MKKNNNKGFTLAELLIVVAIIAVLVAISIPVFTAQLEKAKESTDIANMRAEYAEAMTKLLTSDTETTSYNGPALKKSSAFESFSVKKSGVSVKYDGKYYDLSLS